MASTPVPHRSGARRSRDSGLAVPTLRSFLCAGAPIPGPLVEHARKTLGAKIVSAWGMTENGAVTLIRLDDDDERAFNTTGARCPASKCGSSIGTARRRRRATTGRLQVRACRISAAIYKRPQLNGDRRRRLVRHRRPRHIDDDGYIRINGRSKDIIIRGGENIPVFEIENAAVQASRRSRRSRIVGYPDRRLGRARLRLRGAEAGRRASILPA